MSSFNKFVAGVAVGAIAATIIRNNKEAIAASVEKVAGFVRGLADDWAARDETSVDSDAEGQDE